jgi:hypothetical protein
MTTSTDGAIEKPEVGTVLRALRLLVEPGTVTELRALKVRTPSYRKPHTVAGFFNYDNLEKMAQAAVKLTPDAQGVYLTLNPLNPDILARCCNRFAEVDDKELAADKDVLRRRWLPIDVDPCRMAGISATHTEKAAALETARAVRTYLDGLGWPAPVFADSGNGYHALYRVDLPCDDECVVKRILMVLAQRFDTAAVKVDQGCPVRETLRRSARTGFPSCWRCPANDNCLRNHAPRTGRPVGRAGLTCPQKGIGWQQWSGYLHQPFGCGEVVAGDGC